MFTRHVLVVVAGGFLLPGFAHSEPTVRVGVAVRVYNTARVSADTRERALAAAVRTLLPLDMAWSACETGDACNQPPTANELVVRLVRGPRIDTGANQLVLGEASVGTSDRAGILATIYVDRVQLMANRSGTDATSLLGRAIAHEVGHLLLASTAHSARGLMRARWTPDDLRRNDRIDWTLTEDDAAAIRRRLGNVNHSSSTSGRRPSLPRRGRR